MLRQKGTEPPFTGKFVNHKENGVYVCAGCGNKLFASNTKYESGSGWPSFWDQVSEDSIERRDDSSLWMKRIEIVCKKCGGHLGHIFDDGPNPPYTDYILNILATFDVQATFFLIGEKCLVCISINSLFRTISIIKSSIFSSILSPGSEYQVLIAE